MEEQNLFMLHVLNRQSCINICNNNNNNNNSNNNKYTSNSSKGCVIEFDLEYTKELRELHSDYR